MKACERCKMVFPEHLLVRGRLCQWCLEKVVESMPVDWEEHVRIVHKGVEFAPAFLLERARAQVAKCVEALRVCATSGNWLLYVNGEWQGDPRENPSWVASSVLKEVTHGEEVQTGEEGHEGREEAGIPEEEVSG